MVLLDDIIILTFDGLISILSDIIVQFHDIVIIILFYDIFITHFVCRDRASHNDIIGTAHLCMSKISAPGGEIDGEKLVWSELV